MIDEEVSHIRKLWELWDASPPSPNAPTPPMGDCWNCGLVPPDPPGVKEGSRAGFIRNSPKTYRRIDSIEGHRLPLDAHMTGGEGRRPGARGGVAVVVLLAFLVLAVSYLFDIFAIFGGTVYPSCFMGLFTTCETGAVAAAPPPRPGVPARPVARSRRYNLYRSRLVGPGAVARARDRRYRTVLSDAGTTEARIRGGPGSYARRAPMKVSLPRVRYGRGDDIDITFLQHKLGLSLSASRVARPIGRLESVSYQFVEAVLVLAHALAKR